MKNIIAACIVAIGLIVSANIIHSSLKALGAQMDRGFESIANKNDLTIHSGSYPFEIAGPSKDAPAVTVHMTTSK